jgi:hypothetical protein
MVIADLGRSPTMPERITVRLNDAVYGRLTDAAKARGVDLSSVVRHAVIAYLEGASETAPTLVPLHHPEDCLAVVISHASPRTQRRLAETFTRIDGALKRQGCTPLWFVAETLAHWAAQAERRVSEAAALSSRGCEGVHR